MDRESNTLNEGTSQDEHQAMTRYTRRRYAMRQNLL
jgi:hypothetical protein